MFVFINTQGLAWMSRQGQQSLPRGLVYIFCRHKLGKATLLFGGFLFRGCFVGLTTFA